MSTIFLSYAREDRPRVALLAQQIEEHGWDVWWDREIPPGKTFDQIIEEALEACSCVVVVWSATSVDSRWVRTEAGEGLNRGILLPVLLDDVVIPLAFRRIQAADLTDWEPYEPSVGFDGLIAAIAGLIDGDEAAVELAPTGATPIGATTELEDDEPTAESARADALLDRAREAMAAADWATAASRLEDVLRLDPDRDKARSLLRTVEAHQQAARLFRTATVLAEGEHWDLAADRLAQVRAIDPSYPGAAELSAEVVAATAVIEQLATQDHDSADAERALSEGRSDEAIAILEQLAAAEPGTGKVDELLQRARATERAAELLAEAKVAVEGERWEAVLDRFAEIEALGGDYVVDPEGWRQLAADKLAEREAVQRSDALYDSTLALFESGAYAEALDDLGQLEAASPGYPGVTELRQRIEAELGVEPVAPPVSEPERQEAIGDDSPMPSERSSPSAAGDARDRKRMLGWGAGIAAGMIVLALAGAALLSREDPEAAASPTGGVTETTAAATTTSAQTATTQPSADNGAAAAEAGLRPIDVPADWDVTFETSFDTDAGGWKQGEFSFELADGSRNIDGGQYVWQIVRSEGLNNKSFPDHGVVNDFYVESAIDVIEGGVWHGVVFRNKAAGFYAFLVNEDGRFEVVQYAGAERVEQIARPTPTDSLTSDGFNILSVRGEGTSYQLGINGFVVAEFTDADLDAGQVGLALDLAPGDTAFVVVDYYLLREP